jgi:hypothetical protein
VAGPGGVEQPAGDVVVVDVAELVGDDEPELGGREAVEQRVVDDHALG